MENKDSWVDQFLSNVSIVKILTFFRGAVPENCELWSANYAV